MPWGPTRAAPCAHRQSFPARSPAERSARAASLVSPLAGLPSLLPGVSPLRPSPSTFPARLRWRRPPLGRLPSPGSPGPEGSWAWAQSGAAQLWHRRPPAGCRGGRGACGQPPALPCLPSSGAFRWPGPPGRPLTLCLLQTLAPPGVGMSAGEAGPEAWPCSAGIGVLARDGGELSSGRTPAPPARGLGSGALCRPRSPVCGNWSRGRSRLRTRLPFTYKS